MQKTDSSKVVPLPKTFARPKSTCTSLVAVREQFRKDLLSLCEELVKETTPGVKHLTPEQISILARGFAMGELITLATQINFGTVLQKDAAE